MGYLWRYVSYDKAFWSEWWISERFEALTGRKRLCMAAYFDRLLTVPFIGYVTLIRFMVGCTKRSVYSAYSQPKPSSQDYELWFSVTSAGIPYMCHTCRLPINVIHNARKYRILKGILSHEHKLPGRIQAWVPYTQQCCDLFRKIHSSRFRLYS